MATCAECVYVEVCRFKDLLAPLSDSYIRESECIEKRCGDFQDRSRFAELPRVGDKVYELCRINQFGDYKIDESEIKGFIVDTDGTAFDYELLEKRFFLTREEAEQALREREENA